MFSRPGTYRHDDEGEEQQIVVPERECRGKAQKRKLGSRAQRPIKHET